MNLNELNGDGVEDGMDEMTYEILKNLLAKDAFIRFEINDDLRGKLVSIKPAETTYHVEFLKIRDNGSFATISSQTSIYRTSIFPSELAAAHISKIKDDEWFVDMTPTEKSDA